MKEIWNYSIKGQVYTSWSFTTVNWQLIVKKIPVIFYPQGSVSSPQKLATGP
jgi:hypothetical protein